MGSSHSLDLLKCARGEFGEEAGIEILQRGGLYSYVLDCNLKSKCGTSILHYACANNHNLLVDALLDRNTKHEVANKQGAFPIHAAAYKGNLDVLKILISKRRKCKNGLHVNLKSDNPAKATSLMIACSHCYMDCVEYLVEQYKAEKIDIPDDTLIYAASRTNVKVCEILLQNGEYLNEEASQGGFTALMCAAMSGNFAVVEFLLNYHKGTKKRPQKIVSTNKDREGRTALHWAYCFSPETREKRELKEKIINALIESGCSPEAKANNGKTSKEFEDSMSSGTRRRNSGLLSPRSSKRMKFPETVSLTQTEPLTQRGLKVPF